MWFHLYIDDPTEAYSASNKIMDQHFALLVATRNESLCVFSRLDTETGGVHIYFAPGTELIAKKHNAKPCERPSRQESGGLLCGNQTVIESLFS
jgi:hypothetical protein